MDSPDLEPASPWFSGASLAGLTKLTSTRGRGLGPCTEPSGLPDFRGKAFGSGGPVMQSGVVGVPLMLVSLWLMMWLMI